MIIRIHKVPKYCCGHCGNYLSKSIKCFEDAWDISKDDIMLLQKGRAIKKLGNKEDCWNRIKRYALSG